MQALFSPGSLITVAGAVLTVIGSVAYLTDSPNLSLPAIFYGIPVLLGVWRSNQPSCPRPAV